MRIESLLALFPRLLQSEQQHTYVETGEVRFFYQPLESHYLVMVTSKASNILQDMDTLRLLARIVAEHAPNSSEDATLVQRNALEILLAFDEVISLGFREPVNMSQLHTILAMESQEEIVQEIIAKNKMQEAKEAAKRKAKQMELDKREAARRTSATKVSSSYSGSYAPISGRTGGAGMEDDLGRGHGHGYGYGQGHGHGHGYGHASTPANPHTPTSPMHAHAPPPIQTTSRAGKGMKIGRKTTTID